jgi:hypothetical protein
MIGTTIRLRGDPTSARRTTTEALGFGPRQVCAACLVSGLIAAAITTLTSDSAAEYGPASSFSVNRVNKTDRLQPEPPNQRQNFNSGVAPELRAPKQVPVGCELAFSPIVDRAHANILRACVT